MPDLDRRPAYRLTQAQAADLLGVSTARVAELVGPIATAVMPVELDAVQRHRGCYGPTVARRARCLHVAPQ